VFRLPYGYLSDLRLRPGSSVAATPCPAASGPFFEPVTFCGAAPVSTPFGIVPWYEPAPPLPFVRVPFDPEPALLEILVVANNPGQTPLPGVLLSGTIDGVTGLDGVYRSYVPSGSAVFTLSQLPMGCSSPGFHFILDLLPRTKRTTGILVQC